MFFIICGIIFLPKKIGGSYEWWFFCYLDSYQVLALLYKIREIKNKNPYYDDPIIDSFFKQVIARGGEIANTPNIILRFSNLTTTSLSDGTNSSPFGLFL